VCYNEAPAARAGVVFPLSLASDFRAALSYAVAVAISAARPVLAFTSSPRISGDLIDISLSLSLSLVAHYQSVGFDR
jgi:hypothetical protein